MILALHQTVYEEWNLIFISLFLGAFLVAVYDIFRILRILIKHKNIFVHIQDFFFWTFATIFIYYIYYQYYYGQIRAFFLVFMLLGAFLYANTLSRFLLFFVNALKNRLKKVRKKGKMKRNQKVSK